MNVVATLAEGAYLKGACVLFNSLFAHGYQGLFVVGVRSLSEIPLEIKKNVDSLHDSNQHTDIAWVWHEVETPFHFTNYKPQFMLSLLDAYPDCEIVAYLDPDIVCISSWNWILSSSFYGPVVAADVNWAFPSTHPIRHLWSNMIQERSNAIYHNLDLYFNGGLLVLRKEHSMFLSLWHDYIVSFGSIGSPLDASGEISSWRNNDRSNPLFASDQDALNMALMSWPEPLSTFGPDMMGFMPGHTCLPHAVGSNKPWLKRILFDTIMGLPPRLVDKSFWSYCERPIPVYPSHWILFKRLQIRLSSLIGRFYCRK